MDISNLIIKCKWIICKKLSSVGIDLYQRTDDRLILESVILPYFIKRNEFNKVLFVGCDWYTRGYNKVFKKKKYHTMEIDQSKSKYGSANHIVDSLENIRRHFDENELDLIICNGVFGWGLNEKNEVEKAFQGCYESLRIGGSFILGWNDIQERRPFPLVECKNLKLFNPHVFPPLAVSQYLTDNPNRHYYNFYIKE